MKRVAIVSPHFVPSNLVGAQRARLLARHLPRFGWEPFVVCADARYYEEPLDLELEKLLSDSLQVVRTSAIPAKPIRFVGDMGIRAFYPIYRQLARLIEKQSIDLVFITIPSNFAALLGPLLYRRYGVPYVLDFMDPWAHQWPGSEKWFTKAWFACRLGYLLEPVALKDCARVSAVAPGYYEGLLRRYSWLKRENCIDVPYGAEPAEFEYLASHPRPATLFDPQDGQCHFVYAGAMLPRAFETLEALFQSLQRLKESHPALSKRLRFHFVGTGNDPKNPSHSSIQLRAHALGLGSLIFEHPARIPYLDVLNHLQQAQGVLVMGSSEPHYSPSKVFQALLSGRPLLALLHEESAAVGLLKRAGIATTVSFSASRPVGMHVPEIVDAILACMNQEWRQPPVPGAVLKECTTEFYTGRLGRVFDGIFKEEENAAGEAPRRAMGGRP